MDHVTANPSTNAPALNELNDNPLDLAREIVKINEDHPDLISQTNDVGNKQLEELSEINIQKTDFSPIVNPLPCTPMGTPGNTPTETTIAIKEYNGTSPRQNIVNTLQQVAMLVVQDRDQDIVGIAKDEMARENEVDSGTCNMF